MRPAFGARALQGQNDGEQVDRKPDQPLKKQQAPISRKRNGKAKTNICGSKRDPRIASQDVDRFYDRRQGIFAKNRPSSWVGDIDIAAISPPRPGAFFRVWQPYSGKVRPGLIGEIGLSSYVKIVTAIAGRLALYACLIGLFTLFYAAASGFLSTRLEKAAAAAVVSFVIALAVDRFCPARITNLWTQARARVEAWMNQSSGEIGAWIDACRPTSLRFALVAAAGLSLFLELVLIRWESGLFAVFALYKNFTLLSCFCGLGIGYAKAHDRQLTLAASLPMTLALMADLRVPALRHRHHRHRHVSSRTGARGSLGLFRLLADTSFWRYLFGSLPVYFLLALTFLLNTLALLPVGQFCGRLMQRMPPLESYGYNLLGSLAGVGLLFLLSWAWAGPVIWFGLAAAALLFFQLSRARRARSRLARPSAASWWRHGR